MNNNKQSSIDWLIDNLYLKDSLKWNEIIEKAKAMHEMEIRFSFNEGKMTVLNKIEKSSEEYYNETFNNENI